MSLPRELKDTKKRPSGSAVDRVKKESLRVRTESERSETEIASEMEGDDSSSDDGLGFVRRKQRREEMQRAKKELRMKRKQS